MAREVFTTYCIRDPDTAEVVYVGQTKDFEARRRTHLRLRKQRPNIGTVNIKTWLFDKLSAGKTPVIYVLEHCFSAEASLVSETTWVAKFTAEGHGLLNRWREHRAAMKFGATVREAAGRRTAMPAAHGRRWEAEEVAQLRELVAAGESVRQIAYRLNRTRTAIRMQLDRMGLVVARGKRRWRGSVRPVLLPNVRAVFNRVADG